MIWEHMIQFEKLQVSKTMITQLVVDYPCFKEHYKWIAIDLRKQQALATDPKAM